jgi:membrane protein CcdC involved in cytochrome C biogenesis
MPQELMTDKTRNLLWVGFFFSIAMLILESSKHDIRPYTVWIAHSLIFAIIYITFKYKQFQLIKSIVYAFLPLMVINLSEDLIKLISLDFYDNWNNYFDVAKGFALVWMVAMLYVNHKQKKDDKIFEKQTNCK